MRRVASGGGTVGLAGDSAKGRPGHGEPKTDAASEQGRTEQPAEILAPGPLPIPPRRCADERQGAQAGEDQREDKNRHGREGYGAGALLRQQVGRLAGDGLQNEVEDQGGDRKDDHGRPAGGRLVRGAHAVGGFEEWPLGRWIVHAWARQRREAWPCSQAAGKPVRLVTKRSDH